MPSCARLPVMPLRNVPIKFLWIAALLLSSLACRAATRLVIPDTPTPLPTATSTFSPTLTPTVPPTSTPPVVYEASCPLLLAEIVDAGTSTTIHLANRSEQRFEDGTIHLVSYEVMGDKLSGIHIESVPDELKDERDDRPSHQSIWDYFVSIIPAQERALVSEFAVFTDGPGNQLAAVSPMFDDPEQWVLYVDMLDSKSYESLTYSLIHEQGHLLTLNSEQVSLSGDVLNFPDNERVYKRESSACPQYFTGEGCSEPSSYVNQFFDRFWPYLYPEWQQIDLETDEDKRYIMLDEFYKTYNDQFLSDYAPTSPVEDIAESWTLFVLSSKPELTSIATEKILFFYEFPELVELRTRILELICVEYPQ